MAWIESHQSVWEHAKTRKAARRLGIPTVQVVGHLQSLWHWAIDHAEDGNLSKYDADDLAIAARWEGDPTDLVDALVECGPGGTAGFLERGGLYGPPEDERAGDLVIHDWWEYAGKLIARRRRDRERKAAARSDSPPEDVREASDGQAQDSPEDTASRETVNQPTNQPTSSPDGDPKDHFDPVVVELTRRLAKGIHANGHKVPKPGTQAHWRWFDTMRLLIEKDKADPDEVRRVIDFATTDDFWRANIQSAGSFREKYSQLRIKAGVDKATASPSAKSFGGIIDE